MTFPFVLVGPDGAVVRAVAAESLSDARAILRPTPEQSVRSQASHALPMPKPLPQHVCVGCGLRPRADRSDYCPECQRRRRNQMKTEASERRGGTYGGARAGSGPKPKARPATRSQSRHRPGYWRDYYADPARRARRNAAKRAQRRAA